MTMSSFRFCLLFLLLPFSATAQFEDIMELGVKPHNPFYQYNQEQGSCLRSWTSWKYNSAGDSIPHGPKWKTTFSKDGLPLITTDPKGRPMYKRRYENGHIVGIKKANDFNDDIDLFVMEYDETGRLASLKRYGVEPDGNRDETLAKTYTYSKRTNNKDSVVVKSTYGSRVILRTFDKQDRILSFAIYSNGKVLDSGEMEYAEGELKRYQVMRHYRSGDINEEYTCKNGLLTKITYTKNGKVYRTDSFSYTPEGHIAFIKENRKAGLRKNYFTYKD